MAQASSNERWHVLIQRTHWMLVAVLLAATNAAADPWTGKGKSFNLSKECPANLVVNGGFETPNPSVVPSQVAGHGNSRWGWYDRKHVSGWYPACVRVDWQNPTQQRYMEIHRNSVETAPEGMQSMELLPNGTGVSCQDIAVDKGGRYRLRFMYGRLQTYAWRPPYTNQFIKFESKAVAGIRDATKAGPAAKDVFARSGALRDTQGFTVLVQADTSAQPSQWQLYSADFTAPSSRITLMFTTTQRPKECGTCGSLLDAVCLQRL